MRFLLQDRFCLLGRFLSNCVFSDWLHPVYKKQWASMLAMSQNRDPGPSADKFSCGALRCGRILERSSSVSHSFLTYRIFVTF